MINDKFLETVAEYKLFSPKDRVLVAVSGGADSTALLNLLNLYKDKLGISLHVAHLNHMIRKGDAELDSRYVQNLAQNLKVPMYVESIDVADYAKEKKMSLETAARKIRYEFFARVAKRVGANKIAVGHTADDNVETFLMRLLRGTGMKGLCGIPPKRAKIVRPLIKIWRREIEDYVGALKLVPRRDYTNYESKYMRNRVRLKLIPQLKIYNLNIKEIILQTILLLTGDYEYLEIKAEEALEQLVISQSEEEIKLDISKLAKFEDAIQGHILRQAIENVKGNLTDLSHTHISDLLEKLEAKERWELHLPGGVYAFGNKDRLIFSHEKPKPLEKKEFKYTISIPGEVEILELGKKLRVSVISGNPRDKMNGKPNTAFVDYAALGKKLIVRNRANGDRFIPFGMKGSKKIQDFFVDEKIPVEKRDSVPIVESDRKIVWVGGIRVDERAKVAKNTKKVVKLELI